MTLEPPARIRPGFIAVAVLVGIVGTGWLSTTPLLRPTSGDRSPSASSDTVKGFGANWLLGTQANRNKDVTSEIRRLGARNDFEGIVAVLRTRSRELEQVINEVELDPSYSVSDKRRILQVLNQEHDWALSSYIGLKSIN